MSEWLRSTNRPLGQCSLWTWWTKLNLFPSHVYCKYHNTISHGKVGWSRSLVTFISENWVLLVTNLMICISLRCFSYLLDCRHSRSDLVLRSSLCLYSIIITRLESTGRDRPRKLEFGLCFLDFGLLQWTIISQQVGQNGLWSRVISPLF